MLKRKFHKLYLSLRQNFRYLELTNTSVKGMENIILRQLRDKASKAYLFRDFLIDESRCLYCGSESEGRDFFWLDFQDTLNKETNFLINLLKLVYLLI